MTRLTVTRVLPQRDTAVPSGVFPCRHCGGEGREFRSRYGGNDPDVRDIGPCYVCEGSGNQSCEYCRTGWATHEFRRSSQTDLVCQGCWGGIMEDEAT